MMILTVLFSLILTPFLFFFCGIVILAGLGRTLGVRRLYVRLLLRVFEFGRESIEKNLRRRNSKSDAVRDEIDKSTIRSGNVADENVANNESKEPPTPESSSNPASLDYQSVITREDFILLPEPAVLIDSQCDGDDATTGIDGVDHRSNGLDGNDAKKNAFNDDHNSGIAVENGTSNDDRVNYCCDEFMYSKMTESGSDEGKPLNDNTKREFELAYVLDYIKTGVEAIIEDQVTSRFEAQELKSWNLLTRTNRNYEFINWKITVIWFIGFWIRHFFLFPLRVLICFFGVGWALVWTFCLSIWPDGDFKRVVGELASLVTFRIFALCISAVIKTHNAHWKPRTGGVCVANHTTPADAVLLSTETAFSLVLWLALCTAIVGYLPKSELKRRFNEFVSIMCFQVLSSALSSVITYHNVENRPKTGICVANHTSPIDCLVVACDNCYSLIGQRHGGFLGILQRALARASPHIWFERDEVKDREAVAERIRQHVSNPQNPPILIFPEGTCINNTSVMQFKKGSFEVGSVFYPVAIKYDPRFGDAFWNSSKFTMMQYLYMMMTSWAIVCDVWYLPPMTRRPNETAVAFANRVKRAIAEQGGLVDLMWDGQLKRMKPKKEWKERQQEEFSKRLKVE